VDCRLVIKFMALALLASAPLAFGYPAPALAQADLTRIPAVPRDYKPARTAWGEPDFRGLWPIDHLNMTPLQRQPAQGNRYWLTEEEYAAREKQLKATAERYETENKAGKMGMGHWVEAGAPNRRTSLVIDPPNGRLPDLTAEGKRLSSQMKSDDLPGQEFDWVDDFDSWDRCITRGMPASMFTINYNNGIRIFQAPGVVAIQLEMVHETRIIPTDGTPGIPTQIHNWIGESRGRWEGGNVLVIETTNFKPGPSATNVGTWGSPPGNVTPVSTSARMTERLTMTGKDAIVYEVTWTDPVVFSAPWTARLDWRRNDKYEMYEYACHEGNVQIRGFISSSRAKRAQAAATKGSP
jgi:hypothetical protein